MNNKVSNLTMSHLVQIIFTVVLYLIIIISTFFLCFKLGGYKVFGVNVVEDSYGFLGYWKLNWGAPLMLLSCLATTVLAYTRFKSYISTGLENLIFGHSITAQLLTVISLSLGIYTSVTSASILNWFSPGINAIGEARYGVEYILFITVIVFLSLVKYGIVTARVIKIEKAEHRKNVTDIEIKQTKRVDELERVIRLAPPGKFPSQFAHYADILEDLATENVFNATLAFESLSDEQKTITAWERLIEEQQNYIRASLIALARLAGTYDNAALGVSSPLEYRANLMFKIKDPELLAIIQNKKKHQKRFFIELGSNPEYHLVHSKEYSVLVDNEDESLVSSHSDQYTIKTFLCDPKVIDAVFPVYLDGEGNNTVYNMFGGPEAIATCHPQFIANTKNSADTLHEKGMPKPLVDAAVSYYSGDEKGKSIVSLPISHQRFLQSSLKPENMNGVINIYRNKVDLFSNDDDKFTSFSHLTLPLQISISRIVHFHLMTLKEKSKCR